MCGVAGIISKRPIDVAQKMIQMLSLIQHRGPDASGIAVFPDEKEVTLRVSMQEEGQIEKVRNMIAPYGKILDEKLISKKKTIPMAEYRLEIRKENISPLHYAINQQDGLCVHSIGDHIKVYKEGGCIENMLKKYEIDDTKCRLGIGHVRMATESAEDINAAHPFVSPFYSGLAIVHNGQFTNYFKMRRFLEAKGAKFKTMNDSEAASHLIAHAMRENQGDLKKSLEYAREMMDGVYCIIAATKNQMGFVKDKLGIKPLLVAETEDCIMIGSEQIEFTAIDEGIFAEEMDPGEVRVWNI